MVRTRDETTMREIRALVQSLDVATPLVPATDELDWDARWAPMFQRGSQDAEEPPTVAPVGKQIRRAIPVQ